MSDKELIVTLLDRLTALESLVITVAAEIIALKTELAYYKSGHNNGNGNMEIYTKAIDIARRTPRISWLSFLEGCQADTYYSIADATWTKYQETIKSFIEAPGNNGVATIKAPKKKRIKNESIRLLLESNVPITYVPCD